MKLRVLKDLRQKNLRKELFVKSVNTRIIIIIIKRLI